jgi:hypothetical protein
MKRWQNHKAKHRYCTIKRENGTPTAQEMEHLSSEMEQQQNQDQQVQWRRDKSARALQQRIQSKRDMIGAATILK